jgi:Protein of unknown function (DUF3110)
MSSVFRGLVAFCMLPALFASLATAFIHLSSSRSNLSVQNLHSRMMSVKRTALFDTTKKDSFDMDELKQRIRAEQTKPLSDLTGQLQNSITPLQQHRHKQQRLDTVYIVSFQKCGIQRGVHSIEYPKGSGSNVILAFASQPACHKFAETLRAQQFFDPTVRIAWYPCMNGMY